MDKQAILKPFTAQGRKELKEGQVPQIENVDKLEKKTLKEKDAWGILGCSYPTWRKWQILTVMFVIQISINLNGSLYANGVKRISSEFGISEQAARVPQLSFLCAYALGCELWAPWSEELGRWPTQQLSFFLVNIWQIPCAFAPNYAVRILIELSSIRYMSDINAKTLVICRALGGVSTAGGSVTLGVVADMWLPDDQEYAVAFLVLSSVGGSVVGPIIGGFLEEYAALKWIFWTQLIAGGFVQALHFFTVPETRSTIILDREAKKRRAKGEEVYGPNEANTKGLTFKELMVIWFRPFHMLFTEPIVAWLSAVSGFSDALIFTFLQGFTPVYKKWNFSVVQTGLAFIPLLVGYVLAYLMFLPSIHHFRQKRRRYGSKSVPPEARLWWLLFVILLEPLGLFIFAWTGIGPEYGIPWIAPMIGSTLVAIANYSIYQSSIDYTVAAYGVYAASATGGNDFARDFLAGIAALYSVPIFYRNGERIRLSSKFASKIAAERDAEDESNEKSPAKQGRDGSDGRQDAESAVGHRDD